MTLRSVMEEIESNEFSARVGIASDLRTFLVAVADHSASRELMGYVVNPDLAGDVFLRILSLARRRVDPRYENPWDASLAVYVWSLLGVRSDLADSAAQAVSEAPQTWWAMQVCRDPVLRDNVITSAGITRVEHQSTKRITTRAWIPLETVSGTADSWSSASILGMMQSVSAARIYHHVRLLTISGVTGQPGWVPQHRLPIPGDAVDHRESSQARDTRQVVELVA